MKRRYLYTLLIALCSYLMACTGHFDELNTSKTGSSETLPDGLMTRSLRSGSLDYYYYQRMQQLYVNFYSQYYANVKNGWYTDVYSFQERWADDFWRGNYADPQGTFIGLADRAALLARQQGSPNKEAIARIWKVFLFQRMTDLWGDIPYSQAFKPTIMQPAFDSQRDIYLHMLQELEQMAAQLDEKQPAYGPADILMQGPDAEKVRAWKRFANSLRLRMAMRISAVEPALARSQVQALHPDSLLQQNAHNVLMRVMGATEGDNERNRNPLTYIDSFDEDRVSATLVEYLQQYNDPRLRMYVRPATLDGQYRGFPNGVDPATLTASNYDLTRYARMGSLMVQPYFPTYLLLYAEVCFLKAEAALKGWMQGDAAQYYAQGIQASIAMYAQHYNALDEVKKDPSRRIDPEQAFAAYMEQPQVRFEPSRGLEQIITQKWLANVNNGFESYAEYRRTGLPKLRDIPFKGGDTRGRMPQRLRYPNTPYQFSPQQVGQAAARMGGDDMLIRLWWAGGH